MKLLAVGVVLLAAAGVALLTGVLPLEAAGAVLARVAPILGFVVAITVVAELAAEAGVFLRAGEWLDRLSRGRTLALWGLVVLLATASTAFLSLDTTAVLLTPVVVVVARRAGLDPLPFALTTVWIANAGSLFLPVSNLTNLLAEHALGGIGPLGFLALLLPSALAALAVPLIVALLVHGRQLRGRHEVAEVEPAADRVLLIGAGVVLVALLPALVSGVPVWIPATAAALALVALTAVRRPRALSLRLVPWGLLVFAAGLFLAVEAAHALGATALLGAAAGSGDEPLALARLAGAGALGANAIDNLPAYLALEPVADSPARIAALLIGVNAGPLVTPWASLATLLWHERLVAAGVRMPWSRFVLLGLVVAPLAVAAGVAALVLV